MSELEPTITELEPTATERLRALLDERGVEWDADDEAMDDGSLSQVTYWYCNGIEWSADGRDEYLAFDAVQLLTPEQAIAATLGSCNCSNNCSNSERTSDSDDWISEMEWGSDEHLDGLSRDSLKSEVRWWHERALEMETENTKLLELVRELYEDQCIDGDRWKYRDRMRELGVNE